MPQRAVSDSEIVEAALVGLGRQLAEINEKISGIRRQLGIRGPRRVTAMPAIGAVPVGGRRRGRMSAAGRRRIAEAQRKRWALLKGQGAQPSPVAASKQTTRKKRRMSAAGRKRIAEASTKRWAEFRAKRAAAVKKAAPVPKKAVLKRPAKKVLARPATKAGAVKRTIRKKEPKAPTPAATSVQATEVMEPSN